MNSFIENNNLQNTPEKGFLNRPLNDVEKRLDSEQSFLESPVILKTAKSKDAIKMTPFNHFKTPGSHIILDPSEDIFNQKVSFIAPERCNYMHFILQSPYATLIRQLFQVDYFNVLEVTFLRSKLHFILK
jgi:hypothetical protein